MKKRRQKKMSKIIYDTAMKNYPTRWSREMLDKLLAKKKLTQAEYDAILEAKGQGGANAEQ